MNICCSDMFKAVAKQRVKAETVLYRIIDGTEETRITVYLDAQDKTFVFCPWCGERFNNEAK